MKDISLLTSNGVNVDGSLELFGDISIYNETLEDFLNTVDQKLADIKKYKEEADMKNYAILVHSLKSDSKYFGFTELAKLSLDHELKSKDGDKEYVKKHFDELENEYKRIIDVVSKYLNENK